VTAPIHFMTQTARELGGLLRRREVTAQAVTEACLDRIEALNPHLNAFITVTRARAIERARRADQELTRGRDRGPLHGVPYALKDVIATRGILTTNGSRSSADWVPSFDATVQERLDAAGGVLVGKLNLWELAMAGSAYGDVHNPWALDHSPGGSSSGAGAAVSARVVPIAIGTDTGGSIRIPAAHCGVVGLRPTYGRVSRYGVMANAWSVDTVGPLARTVDDVALTLTAIAGADPRDRTCSSLQPPPSDTPFSDDLKGVRLGVPERFFKGAHPDVERSVRAAIEVLEELGARVAVVDLPHADAAGLARTLHLVEAASFHEQRLRTRSALLGPEVRARLVRAQSYAGVDYVKALRLRTLMMAEASTAFQTCDVIVAPTDRSLPVRLATSSVAAPATPVAEPNTFFASMTGLPALAIPCGMSRGTPALPISMQLHGRPFEEVVLFRVGRAFQRATEWHSRAPASPA